MAEDTRAKDKFELIEYQGKTVRKYPDGTLRGEHGHIVSQTPQRALELIKRRKEQGTMSARKAVARATGSDNFAEGYEKLIGKMVEVVMTETGRSKTDAMRFLAQATGAYAANQPVELRSTQNNNNFVVIQEMPQEYYEAMERVAGRQEEVIDVDTE
jgi:SLT domain-containing protein